MAPGELRIPDIRQLDPNQVLIRYDEPSDALYVHFYGSGQPGVSVQVDDHTFLRLDPTEEQVIGVQIEAFLKSATLRKPSLLALAEFAGVSHELMRQWHSRQDTHAARLEFLNTVIHEWAEPASK